MSIDYKHINNIISNNTWSNVVVNGWNEWRDNGRTWSCLTKEDNKEIYRLHIEEGYTKQQLADMYGKTDKMIGKIFKKYEVHSI